MLTEADRFARWCETVLDFVWAMPSCTGADADFYDDVHDKIARSQARTAPSCDPSGAVREQED